MPQPVRLAFLGCGFITRVHSRHLRALGGEIVPSYASRDRDKAEAYCREFSGAASYGDYLAAIADPAIDAVVVAVPPRFHLDLTLRALAAGKHVLVEKPAFPAAWRTTGRRSRRATRPARVVLVGENDHYKPLAVVLRRLLADGAIGEMVFAHFTTIAQAAEDARTTGATTRRWPAATRSSRKASTGCTSPAASARASSTIHGYRPSVSRDGPGPARQEHDGRVPLRQRRRRLALLLARDSVAAFSGLRLSKLFGRNGVITFESNGLFVFVRGSGLPRLVFPGFRDIRGYQAMYRDFVARDPRRRRAGDEPRARDRRSAADGPDLRDARSPA